MQRLSPITAEGLSPICTVFPIEFYMRTPEVLVFDILF